MPVCRKTGLGFPGGRRAFWCRAGPLSHTVETLAVATGALLPTHGLAQRNLSGLNLATRRGLSCLSSL